MRVVVGIVVGVVGLAGCRGDGPEHTPADAAPPADAFMLPPCVPTSKVQVARCRAGVASTSTYLYTMLGNMRSCTKQLQLDDAQCAQGCSVEADITIHGEQPAEIEIFGSSAHVMCAETVEAQVGDACNVDGSDPCLPTRAVLNSDGTVASQTYLACDATTSTCVATDPPTFAGYLQACDATTLGMYARPGVKGVVDNQFNWWNAMCLIAWDAGAQRITSGKTRRCAGDWQCPAGSLCDDEIVDLKTSAMAPGVCKPGPRGTLTPEMLSP